jgi:hypothetical protein
MKLIYILILISSLYAELIPVWGYGYDSLQIDLVRWSSHPNVQVDSIGNSVQGRIIHRLTITQDLPLIRPTLSFHARTHPLEVQGFWPMRHIIDSLLYGDSTKQNLLKLYRFDFIPMLNPDGVELQQDCPAGFGRCNANGVDIESNWSDTASQEPEVKALRKHFEERMSSSQPIQVMLNMHSAFGCNKFFWIHNSSATSASYLWDQQNFVGLVQDEFHLIQDWNSHTSWIDLAPTKYPESYFWWNHGEEVLALTYEDFKECPDEPHYDKSGMALLHGVHRYLQGEVIVNTQVENFIDPSKVLIIQGENWAWDNSISKWKVTNLEGKIVKNGVGENSSFNKKKFNQKVILRLLHHPTSTWLNYQIN